MSVVTPEVSKLYRIRKTVVKMLENRGYILPEEIRRTSLEEFMNMISDDRSAIALTAFKHPEGVTAEERGGIEVFFPSGDLAMKEIVKCVVASYGGMINLFIFSAWWTLCGHRRRMKNDYLCCVD